MIEAFAAGAVWLYENPVAVVFLILLTVTIAGWFVRRACSGEL